MLLMICLPCNASIFFCYGNNNYFIYFIKYLTQFSRSKSCIYICVLFKHFYFTIGYNCMPCMDPEFDKLCLHYCSKQTSELSNSYALNTSHEIWSVYILDGWKIYLVYVITIRVYERQLLTRRRNKTDEPLWRKNHTRREIKLICMEFEFLFAVLSNAGSIFFLATFLLSVIENTIFFLLQPPSSPCPKIQKYR